MRLRHLLISTTLTLTLTACAQTKFTALEQQQISIEDTTLFERYDAFTVDFAAMRDKDYSFPLPVGKARQVKDYMVEIDTRRGDAVKAMFPGVVRLSRNNPTFGNVIVVRHDNGLETVYGNNAQNLVKSGDRVKAGQTIAIVGSNHQRTYSLFAIMVNGRRINPETIISLESHQLRPQTLLFQRTADWKVDISVLRQPVIEQQAPLQWWSYPLPDAKVISPYGKRGGRRHTGVVRIRHDNGLETYYSHNSKNLVKAGEQVKAGQVIALTGQTGRASTPHLHFETRINGQPVNPNTYFDHATHSLRLDAFSKKKDGYVIKRR